MGNYLFTVILVIQVILGLALVSLILMQHGKGADMGAAFGSGASGSLFGASGSANILSTATSWLAACFFVSSLSLAFIASHDSGRTGSVLQGSVVESVAPAASPATPSDKGDAAPAIPK